MMDVFEYSPHRVLAIFAHPDDAEVAAGGTLALYASQGSHVHIVSVAQGDKGRGDTSARESEALDAVRMLGIDSYETLGYNDGEFDNDLPLRKMLTEKIRSYAPDLVICPDPTAVFFSDSYINHRDHRQTGWAVLDVVSSAVGNAKYFSESSPVNVSHVLCAGTLEPNCFVDIAEKIEDKVNAVACYRSQIGDDSQHVTESLRQSAQQSAKGSGSHYVEVFRHSAISGMAEQI